MCLLLYYFLTLTLHGPPPHMSFHLTMYFLFFHSVLKKVYLEYSRFGINLHNYIKKFITQMLTLE